MKKTLLLCIPFAICLAFTGCSNSEKNQEQKQIEGLPTQEKKKIKQFQNLMNYDGTKQRVIEDED